MKRLMVVAAVMLTAACAVKAQNAQTNQVAQAMEKEETSPLSFDVTADIYSAYVWRGLVRDKHAVVQPGGSATFDMGDAGALSASVWMNWDITQKSKCTRATRTGGGIDELDATLSYSKDFGPVSLTAGHIWYSFPGNGWPKHSYTTEEVFLALAYNNDIVTPYISGYYDYNRIKGAYANLGLNKEIDCNDRLTLGLDGAIGGGTSHYVKGYFGEHDEAFTDTQVKVYASYKLTDTFSIGATLAYTWVPDFGFDGEVRDNAKSAYGVGDLLWGGINLRASF